MLSTIYFQGRPAGATRESPRATRAAPGNCISRSDALESEDLTAQQLTALFY
tara:strand:+ start:67 stop:222 length:156 start_codon:yes stop_codon:yes gene_type:complete